MFRKLLIASTVGAAVVSPIVMGALIDVAPPADDVTETGPVSAVVVEPTPTSILEATPAPVIFTPAPSTIPTPIPTPRPTSPMDKAADFLSTYRQGRSPLREHLDLILELSSTVRNAKLILAIAGVQTGFGSDLKSIAKHNPFCTNNCDSYENWVRGLEATVPSVNTEIQGWDGTSATVSAKLCTKDCGRWVEAIMNFYNRF